LSSCHTLKTVSMSARNNERSIRPWPPWNSHTMIIKWQLIIICIILIMYMLRTSKLHISRIVMLYIVWLGRDFQSLGIHFWKILHWLQNEWCLILSKCFGNLFLQAQINHSTPTLIILVSIIMLSSASVQHVSLRFLNTYRRVILTPAFRPS
jgi:hypothetical protein